MKTKSQLPKKMEVFFQNMIYRGNPVKYLRCDNLREHQRKLQKVCGKENVKLEYTKPHKPQLNGVIEGRFDVIK